MPLCPDRDYRIPSGCSIMGIMDLSGRRFSGEAIISGMATMRERANGLGGGFAAYGIYPQFADCYAFHLMFEDREAQAATEKLLRQWFEPVHDEPIPTRPVAEVGRPPILWRYFLRLRPAAAAEAEEEAVVAAVMRINTSVPGAFVASSGKNMGIFKGVGYPEDIGRFFRLEEYEGYIWTGHGRFPTNSIAWWGGAHPFGLLDWSVVHNGEISSYGANRRFLLSHGYHCTLHTDTEVVAYLFDLLSRRHRLPLATVARVLAPPLWEEMPYLPEEERTLCETLRAVYAGAMLNGPFAVVVARHGFMVGLNDRIKLRPQLAARDGSHLFIASEEAAIRAVCPSPREVWVPGAGEPVVGELMGEAA
ncbi:MAG: glutamine amidotransferase family protein [Clostridia bacterium]|nr:glutamine amidotransferase family protein [Clostridia bacterium]MDH7573937.1 glutamine amidotransferase family protein [Clostridia bacterium]